MRQGRYTFFDGIRGLAAIFVLTRHTGDFWHFNFYHSYLAVDLFFILSGFVIAHAYDKQIVAAEMPFKKFMLTRIVRLYPVFFLSAILCSIIAVCSAITEHSDVSAAFWASAATLLFLPYHLAGNDSLFPLNGSYWSLTFELIANAIYALVRPYLDDLRILWIVVISGLGVSAIAFIHGNIDAGFLWTLPHVSTGFLRSIFGIFFGLFLYRKHIALTERLATVSPWLTFPVIGIVLALPKMGMFDAIIDIVSVALVFPICVLISSQKAKPRLESFLLTLGSVSYPIYVLHVPVSIIVLHIWDGIGIYAPLSGVILVIILIGAALIIEEKYDIPIRQKLSSAYAPRN